MKITAATRRLSALAFCFALAGTANAKNISIDYDGGSFATGVRTSRK